MMDVAATVNVTNLVNVAETAWDVEERMENFRSDFVVDLHASIVTLLNHYGLDGQVRVSVAP